MRSQLLVRTILYTRFHIKVHKPYPISDQKGSKTIPFGAAHTYIAYVREYPPGILKKSLFHIDIIEYQCLVW